MFIFCALYNGIEIRFTKNLKKMLEAGKILQDRYLIEKQIGQGGMGAVYVAKDRRFGSTVAIKETLFVGESFEKAFEREARLLNSLRHPALPNVRDYFFEEHKQYLVMEFIAGEDLSEKLEKNGAAFRLEEVLDWSQQLLAALDFLHTQEFPVIHRDIKPQNLKLTPRGQIILLDFGLAKGNPTDASHLTNVNSVFGYSRNYASLEQMQGTGTDPRSDIYSLAATVYHLVTGVPPVDALTRAMKVLNEQTDPLISAEKVHEQVPKGIANTLNNAMNLNANQRPASAKELSEMLKNGDEYENLENKQTVIAKAVPTGFLNQDTQIFPTENDNLTAKNQAVISNPNSEFETKIDKNKYSSKDFQTNVVTANFLDRPKSGNRKSLMAIGAFLSLLILVLGASAFYFLNTGQNAETQTENDQNQTGDSEIQKNQIQRVVTDSNTDNAITEIAETPTETNSLNRAAKTETQPIAKSSEKNPASNKKDSKDKTEMVFVDPEDGNVKIDGDTIETDEVIINDKGIVFKKPPVPSAPNAPPIQLAPEQMKNLSPQQRRKLNELRLMVERKKRLAEQIKRNANMQNPPSPDQQ